MKNLIGKLWKLKTWVAILLIGVLVLGSQPVMAATTQFFTNITATIASITTLNAPTGRSATYTVAASNATATEKAQADYVCDGTADEVEINSTLVLGNVKLTSGTFTESNGGSILIPSNRTLDGNGYNSTLITCANGSSGLPIITNLDTSGGNTNIIVENLKIDGNAAGQTGSGYTAGIQLRKVSNSIIDRIWTQNTFHPVGGVAANTRGAGINILQSSLVTIQNCYTTLSGIAGISVRNACSDIKILNNYAWLNHDEGIAIAMEGGTSGQGNDSIIVTGNNIWNNSQGATSFEIVVADDKTSTTPGNPMTNIIITNNIISPKCYGIFVLSQTGAYPESKTIISSNIIDGTVYGTQESVLKVYKLMGCEIIGNTVINGQVTVDTSYSTCVKDNYVITYANGTGIYVTGSARSQIISNEIKILGDSGPQGIAVTSSSDDCLVSNNALIMAQATGTPGGRALVINTANCSVIGNKFRSITLSSGIGTSLKLDSSSTGTIVLNNDFRNGCKTGGVTIDFTTSTNNNVYGNYGYLATGEIRTISGTITGVNAAGIMPSAVCTLVNGTATVTEAGTVYPGTTTINITANPGTGTFIITLPIGVTGTLTTGTCAITGSVKALVAGANSCSAVGTQTGTATLVLTATGIDNPFGQAVRVVNVSIEVTTQGASSGSMCVGVGSSATADYATIFSVLPSDVGTSYPYFYDAVRTATYGQMAAVSSINWATGSGNRYLNFYAHVANAAYVATYTVTVMGN